MCFVEIPFCVLCHGIISFWEDFLLCSLWQGILVAVSVQAGSLCLQELVCHSVREPACSLTHYTLAAGQSQTSHTYKLWESDQYTLPPTMNVFGDRCPRNWHILRQKHKGPGSNTQGQVVNGDRNSGKLRLIDKKHLKYSQMKNDWWELALKVFWKTAKGTCW